MSGSLSYADDDVEELEHYLTENGLLSDMFPHLLQYIYTGSLRCVAYLLQRRSPDGVRYFQSEYRLSNTMPTITCRSPLVPMSMLKLLSCFVSTAAVVHNISSVNMERARMLVKHGYPVDYNCKTCAYNAKQKDGLNSLRVYAIICKRVRERCRRCAATIMCAWRIAKDVRRMIAKMVWDELKMDEAWNYYKPKK